MPRTRRSHAARATAKAASKDREQIYPDRIEYTGNVNNGLLPSNVITFHRESRSDAPEMFSTNFGVVTGQRLKTLEMKSNGKLVRAYELTYAPSDQISQSLLASIQQFGSDAKIVNGVVSYGTSFPASFIEYSPETTGFGPSSVGLTMGNGDPSRYIEHDFNGDGKSDVVYIGVYSWLHVSLSTRDGFTEPAIWITLGNGDPSRYKFADFDGDGKTDVLYIGFDAPAMNDITERVRSEAALKESELRYRSLFENMLDGYAYCRMLYDDHGRPNDFIYLSVNSAFERLTGMTNVVGMKVTDVIPGIQESYPLLLETYGRVAATGTTEKFEIEFKPLNMWLTVSVYSTERGFFAAVFDNITERKRAEEALAAAHRQLQSVIDNTSSLVYACDLEGRFVIANAALGALLQTTPAQMLGKRRHEFMPWADADKHEAN